MAPSLGPGVLAPIESVVTTMIHKDQDTKSILQASFKALSHTLEKLAPIESVVTTMIHKDQDTESILQASFKGLSHRLEKLNPIESDRVR